MKTARELMSLCVEKRGSDLHINPGRQPVLRVKGDLVSVGEEGPGIAEGRLELLEPLDRPRQDREEADLVVEVRER